MGASHGMSDLVAVCGETAQAFPAAHLTWAVLLAAARLPPDSSEAAPFLDKAQAKSFLNPCPKGKLAGQPRQKQAKKKGSKQADKTADNTDYKNKRRRNGIGGTLTSSVGNNNSNLSKLPEVLGHEWEQLIWWISLWTSFGLNPTSLMEMHLPIRVKGAHFGLGQGEGGGCCAPFQQQAERFGRPTVWGLHMT